MREKKKGEKMEEQPVKELGMEEEEMEEEDQDGHEKPECTTLYKVQNYDIAKYECSRPFE